MTKLYKVYSLIDPRKDIPFYVGITCQAITDRFVSHCGEHTRANRPKDRYIRAMASEGVKPLVRILEYVDNEKAARISESEWIKDIERDGYKLTNVVRMNTFDAEDGAVLMGFSWLASR
jgi:hypothetical protein